MTVRQLLNHSAGWLGDDYGDFGRGDDALARFLAAMKQLPQLTPPGQVLAYNNAAIVVAGGIIETLTGKPYETALQELVLDPLGLKHSGFFTDRLVGENISASHDVEKDRAVVIPGAWAFPRSIDSTGGLISSAREQLAYMRFHLGDGKAADGKQVLTPAVSPGDAVQPRSRRHHHHGARRRLRRILAAAHRRGRSGVPARRFLGRAELRLLLRARPAVRDDGADQFDERRQAPLRAGAGPAGP